MKRKGREEDEATPFNVTTSTEPRARTRSNREWRRKSAAKVAWKMKKSITTSSRKAKGARHRLDRNKEQHEEEETRGKKSNREDTE